MPRFLAVAAALVATLTASIYGLGESLFLEDRLERADLCHVLAGPHYRIHYGVDLHRRGFCERLVFIGAYGRSNGLTYADRRRQLAIRRGVPAEAILTDDTRVYSTYAEIERLGAVIDDIAFDRKPIVMLISDPYHMRRTRMVFSWLAGDQATPLMAPVSFERSDFERTWWLDAWSIRMVISEGIKMAYYATRYLLSATFLDSWLKRLEKVNG